MLEDQVVERHARDQTAQFERYDCRPGVCDAHAATVFCDAVHLGVEVALDRRAWRDGIEQRAVWRRLRDAKPGAFQCSDRSRVLGRRGREVGVELRARQEVVKQGRAGIALQGHELRELLRVMVGHRDHDAHRLIRGRAAGVV